MSLRGKGSRHCALHSTQRSWCRSSANSRGLGPQHTHRYSNTTLPLLPQRISSNFGRLSPGWAETEIAIGPHPLGCRGHEKGVDEEALDEEALGGSIGGEGGN